MVLLVQEFVFICTLIPVLQYANGNTSKVFKSKWYRNLNKPRFQPPAFVFSIVWTILYASLAYSYFLVRSQLHNFSDVPSVIYLYWIQLTANLLWPKLYFIYRQIDLALLDLGLMITLSIDIAIEFFLINTTAGLLLIPYILWIMVAIALTQTTKELNLDFAKEPEKIKN